MLTLIKNSKLIDSGSQITGEYDLIIENDKIKEVGQRGEFKSGNFDLEVEADGLWLMPGLVDLHVHFREPGFEWKETIKTGSTAAIRGGYTTVCCMPNTSPTTDNAQVVEFILDRAKSANLAKVLPIGAVSLGLKGEKMSPLSELRKAGCAAFSDDGEPIYNSNMMRRALEWCLMLDATICCHEEDKALTCGGCMNESAASLSRGLLGMPTVGEDVMVARDIELARYTKGKVHICHVSTARSLELVRRAKNDGIRISCEVAPHHLVLNEEMMPDFDTSYKMSPPLRSVEDMLALQKGLSDGTIDAIASDHAPHDPDSKQKEFSEASFGIIGLQTTLSLMLDFVNKGVITPLRAVEMMSTGPAKVIGIEAGSLRKGAVADLVLVDPKHHWQFSKENISSVSKNSPFLNQTMIGAADTVFVNGKLKLKKREICNQN